MVQRNPAGGVVGGQRRGGQDGLHVGTWKGWLPVDFDRDFESAEGAYHAAMFTPDQDLTDPTEEPLYEWPGTFVMRRLPSE